MTRRLRNIFLLARGELSTGRKRASWLALAVAITTTAWLLLAAAAAPFVERPSADDFGVTIRNGSQANAPLPLRYAARIEAIEGARQVSWFSLQLAACGAAGTTVTLNAYGGPGATAHVAQAGADASALQRWQDDPAGILATRKAATDCHWREGQGVEPPSAVGGTNIPLHVSGVIDGSDDVAFAHAEYIDRVAPMFGKGHALYFLASTTSPRDAELLAARIDAAFADDFPAVSATTNATTQNAWARFGKVQLLLAFVMGAILLCTASVLMSVMAHLAAQRRARLAVLQVMGFRRGTLFGAIAVELLVVGMAGVALGASVGALAAHRIAPTTLGTLTGGFQVPGWAWASMPAWVALLLAIALAWPGALVARLRPVDYRAI